MVFIPILKKEMIFLKSLHGGVILAGGKGSRLMPLTAGIPKPLLTVNGKSPLERSVNALVDANVKNIAVTTGHLGEWIEKCIFDDAGNISYVKDKKNINVNYYREEFPMGTAGMIFKILPFLDETFFVLSGDVVFDFPLLTMLDFHKEKNAAVTIASVKSYNPTEYGTIISENGIITAFREKPSWKQVISTKINAGIYILNRKVLENLRCGFTDFASELFPFLLSQGETLACFETQGYWCDMGTPESYHSCNMYLSGGENVMGDYISISNASQISHSVIMNGVRVGENTKIINSVIGEGASIGKNCVIENAVVGNRALICDNAVVEKGGYVYEDSIVGKGKTVSEVKKDKELFSDSGEVELSTENIKKSIFLGKALSSIFGERKILIFHDNSEKAKKVYNFLLSIIQQKGGNAAGGEYALYPIASFSAIKNNALSVFLKDSPDSNTITATIFDENGLPLSREEQIICEKIPAVTDKEMSTAFDFSYNKESFSNDYTSVYLAEKIQKSNNLYGIQAVFNNSAPCRLLSRIIKKLQGDFLITDAIDEHEGERDCFYIDESGRDVFCITKNGKRLSKFALFSIASVHFPQSNIPIPEHFQGSLCDLIESHGGSYNLFSDSISDRKKADGFYNLDDGISIVLAVLSACSSKSLSLDNLAESVSDITFAEKTVLFQGTKGSIFERLTKTTSEDLSHGIKRRSQKGVIAIVPQYKNAFKIFAEALSAEAADELLSEAEADIIKFSHEK